MTKYTYHRVYSTYIVVEHSNNNLTLKIICDWLYIMYSFIVDKMKSQLVILLQFILVSCSLLATDATDYCDNLLHQCNQFKDQCSPTMITVKSCCDLADLPLSKAPSGVYTISTKCNCQLPFTANLAYCDMETSDGGWMVIQRNIHDFALTFNKGWSDF